jgi:serine/threonine-protein kinase HipA
MADRPDPLSVWLYGTHVADLYRNGRRLRLQFTDDARQRFGLGSPVLSCSLPISVDSPATARVRDFFDGLAPEGPARGAIQRMYRLPPDSLWHLLRAVGHDCAGAVTVLDTSPSQRPEPRYAPLTGGDITRMISDLPARPLGDDELSRKSLGGVFSKLLLGRTPDGHWAQPQHGAPSTHIIKPDPQRAELPGLVYHEILCMRLAQAVGLTPSETWLSTQWGVPCLVQQRYDREMGPQGLLRVHQEDMCQALGYPPAHKYEIQGGPRLQQMARLLEQHNPDPQQLDQLLRYATFHALCGNADSHAKNYAILHSADGGVRLAPIYDVDCMIGYHNIDLTYAHTLHGRWIDVRDVEPHDLVQEAGSWGLPQSRATLVVQQLAAEMQQHLDRAAQGLPVGDDVLRFLHNRTQQWAGSGAEAHQMLQAHPVPAPGDHPRCNMLVKSTGDPCLLLPGHRGRCRSRIAT